MNKNDFFKQAFQRNIGLLTLNQQEHLKNCTVGVVGLGGVGGSYVLSLARIGIGKMLIADFDHFDIVNMNRQAGAMMSTLGKPKAESIQKMALDINPFMEIQVYSKGVDATNIEHFVKQCDVVIDAIDFYCINSHRTLHETTRRFGKYSLFAIPLGFSATMQVFSPKGMSFEDYFDFKSCNDFIEQVAAFAVGAAPQGTHWSYLKLTGEEIANGTPPSLNCSVNLCTGFVVSSTLLILTGQWNASRSAPSYIQCDARKFKLAKGKLWWGNRGFLQRLKRWVVVNKFSAWREKINQRDTEKQKAFTETVQKAI